MKKTDNRETVKENRGLVLEYIAPETKHDEPAEEILHSSLVEAALKEPKQAFNGFVAIVAIKPNDSKDLELMTVDYNTETSSSDTGVITEQRLPGGTIKPEHVALAFAELNNVSRYQDLKMKVEREAGYLSMDNKMIEGKDHKFVHDTWEKFTGMILEGFGDPHGDDFRELIARVYAMAAIKEAEEEFDGKFGKAYVASIGYARSHKKVTLVVTELEAPEQIENPGEADHSWVGMRGVGPFYDMVASRHKYAFRAGCKLYAEMNAGNKLVQQQLKSILA